MLGMMMLIPFVFVILAVDPTIATIGTMAANLGMIFWMRKTFKSGLGNILGTKVKFACLSCGATKFDSRGTCHRCGSRSRKSV